MSARQAHSRGEKEFDQVLVEIDIWGWYQFCAKLSRRKQCIIDPSPNAAQHKFLDKNFDMTTHGFALQQSIASDEVFLKWRGTIPMFFFFSVLDHPAGQKFAR